MASLSDMNHDLNSCALEIQPVRRDEANRIHFEVVFRFDNNYPVVTTSFGWSLSTCYEWIGQIEAMKGSDMPIPLHSGDEFLMLARRFFDEGYTLFIYVDSGYVYTQQATNSGIGTTFTVTKTAWSKFCQDIKRELALFLPTMG